MNTGEFPYVRLCGRIDPCAAEEGAKGLRALGVRVPDPGRAQRTTLPCVLQKIVPFGTTAQKGCFEFKGFELEGSEF